MKKSMLVVILVALGGCLLVTSMALQKQTATEEPKKESNRPDGLPAGTPMDKKSAMSQMQQRLAAESKKRKAEEMKAESDKKQGKPVAEPYQQDLTSNWDSHRKDGEEGAQEVIKDRARRPDANLKASLVKTIDPKTAEDPKGNLPAK